MATDAILQKTTVFIEPEETEGTYVAPSAAASAIAVLEDGVNELVTPSKEIIERVNTNSSLDNNASRTGIKSVNGTLQLEFKAGDSEAVPEYGDLVESAMGTTSAATADLDTGTSHTASVINMASTTGLAVGDIVAVKDASGNIIHVSLISALTTDTSITLLVADGAAFADTVTVKKMVDYETADSGHPSFSVTKYETGSDTDYIETYGAGCKVGTMAIENFTTGQMPTISFTYEGMSFGSSSSSPSYTPTYDSAAPVIALGACIYQDGTALGVNDFTLSLENTLGFKTTTCSSNGRTGSRVTARNITGTLNPYKQDNSVAQYTKWLNDTTFSIFGYAYNPDSSGNMTEVVAFYLPSVQITEFAQADNEGLLQDSLSWTARKHATLPALRIAYC